MAAMGETGRTALALTQKENLESTLPFGFPLFSFCLEGFVDLLADLLRIRFFALSSPTLLGGLVQRRGGDSGQRVHALVEGTAHFGLMIKPF